MFSRIKIIVSQLFFLEKTQNIFGEYEVKIPTLVTSTHLLFIIDGANGQNVGAFLYYRIM